MGTDGMSRGIAAGRSFDALYAERNNVGFAARALSQPPLFPGDSLVISDQRALTLESLPSSCVDCRLCGWPGGWTGT